MSFNYRAQPKVGSARGRSFGAGTDFFKQPAYPLALVFTLGAIVAVNPSSLANFLYYFLLWSGFIFVFHREELPLFAKAFVINSFFIGIYYLIQTHVYPTSYGTTSPYGSWTDDSFFFSLAADHIPAGMELRDYYYAYSEPYSSIMRTVSLLPINHPMDLIFFQSGVAALLTTFSRRFTLQETGDERAASAAYFLTMLCPFLMMNGGVILVRDTFAAALFIYSLSCINNRQWLLAIGAVAVNFAIRPGTAAILLPAYFVLNLSNIRQMTSGRAAIFTIGLPVALVASIAFAAIFLDLSRYQYYLEYMSLSGREATDLLTADPSANQILLSIQQMPFWERFPLNGAYMFAYPFFSMSQVFDNPMFDARFFTMNFLYPLLAVAFNGWFVAGSITRIKTDKGHRHIVAAYLLSLLLIGSYSLQSRHKTVIQPLFYVIGAIGFTRAKAWERQIGYVGSVILLLLEVGISSR